MEKEKCSTGCCGCFSIKKIIIALVIFVLGAFVGSMCTKNCYSKAKCPKSHTSFEKSYKKCDKSSKKDVCCKKDGKTSSSQEITKY